jgi:hypothetical protein
MALAMGGMCVAYGDCALLETSQLRVFLVFLHAAHALKMFVSFLICMFWLIAFVFGTACSVCFFLVCI